VQFRTSKLSPQLQLNAKPMLFRLGIAQIAASSGSDFIAQSIMVRMHKPSRFYNFSSSILIYLKFSKIYRCWITWGQDIRVVIIPSFFAVVYLGQSVSQSESISSFHKPNLFIFSPPSSYLSSHNRLVINFTSTSIQRYLGLPDGLNKFRLIHAR
jgi:hypothetical protein